MFVHHLDWSLSTLHPSFSSSSSPSSTRSHLSTTSSLSSTFSDSPPQDPIPPSSPSPRTQAFFASPFNPTPAPPTNTLPSSSTKQISPRSLTADFFASPPSSVHPTPPPSIYTPSSVPTSPLPSSPNSRDPSPSRNTYHHENGSPPPPTLTSYRLPPLSRFFPSRYKSDHNSDLLLPSSPSPIECAFRNPDVDTDATPHLSYSIPHFQLDFDDHRKPDHHWKIPVPAPEPEPPSPVSPISLSSISPVSPPSPFAPEQRLPSSTIPFEPGTILSSTLDGNVIKGTKSFKLVRSLGHGAFSCVWLAEPLSFHDTPEDREGALVAVKLSPEIDNSDPIANFTLEREAEILRHISHPNIVPLLALFTLEVHPSPQPLRTPTLILPYIPGTDLLDLVNSDTRHARLCEGVLRRIIRELIGVLAWLHDIGDGVGVVHRDVKLENVLLTIPDPTSSTPSPLIKLTDFGLARVVRTGGEGAELLSARCGSEAYAAPELVVGGHSKSSQGSHCEHEDSKKLDVEVLSSKGKAKNNDGRAGWYDGRLTDTWAVGVLIYALVCRELPFGEGVPNPKLDHVGGEIEKGREIGSADRSGREKEESLKARRSWLMRIARGEYDWPNASSDTPFKSPSPLTTNLSAPEQEQEPCGTHLAYTQGVRKLVGKLLVRDPRRRARLTDLLRSVRYGGDAWLVSGTEWRGEGQWAEDGKVEGVFGDVAWREFQ